MGYQTRANDQLDRLKQFIRLWSGQHSAGAINLAGIETLSTDPIVLAVVGICVVGARVCGYERKGWPGHWVHNSLRIAAIEPLNHDAV
jgi:hypothetical protein